MTSEVPQIKDHMMFNSFCINWWVIAFQQLNKLIRKFFWRRTEVDFDFWVSRYGWICFFFILLRYTLKNSLKWMKCYFYKCDKNYLLLEKGHFKRVHKSWRHQLIMFLYSKVTFSTDRKLRELWELKVPPAVPYIVQNLTKLKGFRGFFLSVIILSLLSFRWNFFLSNGGNNWERGEIMVFNQIRTKEGNVRNK